MHSSYEALWQEIQPRALIDGPSSKLRAGPSEAGVRAVRSTAAQRWWPRVALVCGAVAAVVLAVF